MTDRKHIGGTDLMKAELQKIESVIQNSPFTDDWNSLAKALPPAWFPDAKFGIFIHWGLYSIAAHSNEWYSRNMYIREKEEWEYHRKTFGDHTRFGYQDFIPMFRAEAFCPGEWADLIRESGARYVFPVAEHHDGFQMYRSCISRYNTWNMGPHRDILGELKAAFQEQGLHFCTSSHRAEHWFFMGHGREFDSDVREPMKRGDFYWPAMPERDHQDLKSTPYPSREFLEDWLLRTCELVDRYCPELLYFDWWIQHEAFKPYLKKAAAYYYNRALSRGIQGAICYKHDAMMFGCGIPEIERGGFRHPKPWPWQTDTSIARNSWCYTDHLEYRSTREIICMLIETVSKNGNLVLNIGPRGDGSIPEKDQEIMRQIGAWLRINKEAIYGSRVWRVSGEGPTETAEGQFTDLTAVEYQETDFRFTVHGDSIYVFVMQVPRAGRLTIRSLQDSCDQNLPGFHGLIEDVAVLGAGVSTVWHTDREGLHVDLGTVHSSHDIFSACMSDLPIVLRIRIK